MIFNYKCLKYYLFISLISCNLNRDQDTIKNNQNSIMIPVFNQDSAYKNISDQVNFGPRVPGSEEHYKCKNYISKKLSNYCDTLILQDFEAVTFDNKILNSTNIIGSFSPNKAKRILLCAHWDTRPFADQDSINKNKPIIGANDGASGVGVLMEIARQFSILKPKIGVDIIFFDVEDYGQPDDSDLPRVDNSYCLGSQYWSNNPHKRNYFAKYGILLDMVGGEKAVFTQELASVEFAPKVLSKVWLTGIQLGFNDYFSFEKTGLIVDDHLYINNLSKGRVPTINIIEHDKKTKSKFYKHWHTHNDNIENIDRQTLKVVGQTLLHVIYNE